MELNNKTIKILFILPSLTRGGAERVVSFLAQNIDKKKFYSRLLILYNQRETDYEIQGIPCEYLNKKRSLYAIPEIFKAIRRNKPDIVFTSIGQLNILGGMLSSCFPKIKFIGRESSIASLRSKPTGRSVLKKKFFYNKLSVVVCQSADMKADLQKVYQVQKPLLPVIGNPITFQAYTERKTNKNKVPILITIGRLEKVKGVERIIEVLKKLDFDFKYILIGSGSLKEVILEKIKRYNLEGKVKYIPFTNEVSTYLRQADLFLQGSYVEGFPNTLLESCSVGTPVIAFKAPGGTKEIVEAGVNGFLVEDEDEFAEKIQFSIFSKQWDANSIINSVVEKYDGQVIIKRYEKLFEQ